MKQLMTLIALTVALMPFAASASSPGYPDAGLPVTLLDPGGDVLASTETGADGTYEMVGGEPGEMDRVVIVRPDGGNEGHMDSGGKEGQMDGVGGDAWYTLDDGPHVLADAPVQLWLDMDGDGEADQQVGETATNADGAYYLTVEPDWLEHDLHVVIILETGGDEPTGAGGTALWYAES